jgi:hypothetical protein
VALFFSRSHHEKFEHAQNNDSCLCSAESETMQDSIAPPVTKADAETETLGAKLMRLQASAHSVRDSAFDKWIVDLVPVMVKSMVDHAANYLQTEYCGQYKLPERVSLPHHLSVALDKGYTDEIIAFIRQRWEPAFAAIGSSDVRATLTLSCPFLRDPEIYYLQIHCAWGPVPQQQAPIQETKVQQKESAWKKVVAQVRSWFQYDDCQRRYENDDLNGDYY